MEACLPILKKCTLFADLTEEEIEAYLLPLGHLRQAPKGNYLLLPQEKMEQFAVLLEGKIHILHIFSDGTYSIMDALKPGEVFGADLICTRSRLSPYHAVAAEHSRLMFFPWELFLKEGLLLESLRQKILGRFLLLISNCNMQKEYRLAILSQKGLRERIVTYLTMQADKRHTRSFTIPFSREEMASFLCVNRSALSHELSLMEQEGLLTFRKNSFTLLWKQART